jgi:hypothetical protein
MEDGSGMKNEGSSEQEVYAPLAVYFKHPEGVMLLVMGDIHDGMWKDGEEGYVDTLDGRKPVFIKGSNVAFVRTITDTEFDNFKKNRPSLLTKAGPTATFPGGRR